MCDPATIKCWNKMTFQTEKTGVDPKILEQMLKSNLWKTTCSVLYTFCQAGINLDDLVLELMHYKMKEIIPNTTLLKTIMFGAKFRKLFSKVAKTKKVAINIEDGILVAFEDYKKDPINGFDALPHAAKQIFKDMVKHVGHHAASNVELFTWTIQKDKYLGKRMPRDKCEPKECKLEGMFSCFKTIIGKQIEEDAMQYLLCTRSWRLVNAMLYGLFTAVKYPDARLRKTVQQQAQMTTNATIQTVENSALDAVSNFLKSILSEEDAAQLTEQVQSATNTDFYQNIKNFIHGAVQSSLEFVPTIAENIPIDLIEYTKIQMMPQLVPSVMTQLELTFPNIPKQRRPQLERLITTFINQIDFNNFTWVFSSKGGAGTVPGTARPGTAMTGTLRPGTVRPGTARSGAAMRPGTASRLNFDGRPTGTSQNLQLQMHPEAEAGRQEIVLETDNNEEIGKIKQILVLHTFVLEIAIAFIPFVVNDDHTIPEYVTTYLQHFDKDTTEQKGGGKGSSKTYYSVIEGISVCLICALIGSMKNV